MPCDRPHILFQESDHLKEDHVLPRYLFFATSAFFSKLEAEVVADALPHSTVIVWTAFVIYLVQN